MTPVAIPIKISKFLLIDERIIMLTNTFIKVLYTKKYYKREFFNYKLFLCFILPEIRLIFLSVIILTTDFVTIVKIYWRL